MSFFDELKRRNVLRVGTAYVVTAWLITQVAAATFPAFGFGGAGIRITVIVLAIGLLPALVFAWVFEITPDGLKKEADVDRSQSITPRTGKMLDRTIMVVLALALGYFALERFVLNPARVEAQLNAARQQGRSDALVESYGAKSIAVLPFVDMSAGKDQEYFSDGISEELLNLLARIPELRVISRSSAFSFKGHNLKIPEIATRLHVAHVLEGSVRKSGNRVRITAQLIEGRSDTHVWSQTWDRPLDDIFAVQDEIAAAVVEQLKVKLLGAAPQMKKIDPRAFALFLQARQLFRQGTAEGFEQSSVLYRQALAIDPSYAAAWVGLATNYRSQADQGLRPVDEGYQRAREAVNSALAIDPDLSLAHAELGRIAMGRDTDLAGAARHYERALALDPGNPDIVRDAAILARSLCRFDKAIALGEYAVARDPVNPRGYHNLGLGYLHTGRLDEATAAFRTAVSLSPGRIGLQYTIGVALLLRGDSEGALTAMQQESSPIGRLIGLSMAYHALGQSAASDSALNELIKRPEPEGLAYNIAYILAWRGETDRAFASLEKAVAYRGPGLLELPYEELFANLHDDPRWLPFLRKLGQAPEQLAAIKFEVTLPK